MVLSVTVLPPVLGPLIRRVRQSASSVRVKGTTFLRERLRTSINRG